MSYNRNIHVMSITFNFCFKQLLVLFFFRHAFLFYSKSVLAILIYTSFMDKKKILFTRLRPVSPNVLCKSLHGFRKQYQHVTYLSLEWYKCHTCFGLTKRKTRSLDVTMHNNEEVMNAKHRIYRVKYRGNLILSDSLDFSIFRPIELLRERKTQHISKIT